MKLTVCLATAGLVWYGIYGAAPVQAQADSTNYVKWTEPKESSFSVEVPRGWSVAGGLYRVAPTDVRQGIAVESPEKDMSVLVGDPSLPTFATLAPIDRQMGRKEGETNSVNGCFAETYMHYMSGLEFNRWYLKTHGPGGFDNIQIKGEKSLPQIADSVQAETKRQIGKSMNVETSAAITEFTAVSKETGKRVTGALISTTQLLYNSDRNGGTWHANPTGFSVNDDQNKDAHIKTTFLAGVHMRKSWASNPVWSRKENQRVTAITQASIKQQLAKSNQAIAKAGQHGGGGSRSAGSMSAYWRHNAERAQQQHQFINYIRDEKDVVDTDGTVVTVPDR